MVKTDKGDLVERIVQGICPLTQTIVAERTSALPVAAPFLNAKYRRAGSGLGSGHDSYQAAQ